MKRQPHYLAAVGLLTIVTLFLGCNVKQADSDQTDNHLYENRQYLIEKVGQADVVQLYADGFEKLTSKEKTFSYYIYLASLAARDIAVDQRHPDALDVRDLIEELYRHSAGLDSTTRERITRYLKLFWLNNGFYDNVTLQKFAPECTFAELKNAMLNAQNSGATFETPGESIAQRLDRLQEVIFDPDIDPILTNKTPGEDWIRGSAVNFYGHGLSYDEVDKWAKAGNEKNPLNSIIEKNGKVISEIVWRAGGEGIPQGKYASYLNASIGYLEMAIPYAASDHQAEVLRTLIKFYRTGSLEDFRQFNILWVKDSSSVDFIHGFIEVYLDPRGQKGEFESVLFYTDPEQTQLMQNLAKLAQHFEDNAPWDKQFKKTIDRVPIANVINVVLSTGGCGPVSPVGINLPNEENIREHYGSKSILLHNVSTAIDKSSGKEMLQELAWDEEEIMDEELYGIRADNLHTAMHEVIGHGSGKPSPRLGGKDPSFFLPGYYNTLEEARSDLMALWNAWDPNLVTIGIAKDEVEARKIGETMYRQQIRSSLKLLYRIGNSDQLEDDHFKNRQLISEYIKKNSRAIRVESRNGKTYFRIVDFAEARKAVGQLLAEIMRIKGEGDLAAARRLIDTYGLKVDSRLRNEIQDRVKNLNLPSYTGFIMPQLEPVSDPTAKIVDVKISYPMDLAKQMLEFSLYSRPFRESR